MKARAAHSLRGRLLIAFTLVALAAVALVTAAALVGSSQGLAVQQETDRRVLADRTAAAAAAAYQRSRGWAEADLTEAAVVASGADARLVVRDLSGAVVSTSGRQGMGNGSGMGNRTPQPWATGDGAGAGGGTPVSAPVVVAVTTVGTATLVFPRVTNQTGRPVAWAWIGLAAVAALGLALLAAWLLTRMLTRPLSTIILTARSFAGGDRGARTGLDAPGEIGELAAAFDETAAQVQLSEQARRQLSADVAHELRTPLAALQAGLEELRDGLAPADTSSLAGLHDQSLRLGRVVEDLATLSAADAAPLTLRRARVDLTEVAARAADAHEAQLRAAGLLLSRHLDGVPVLVQGDAGRLDQVVGNLLQNCARHCRPGDRVELAVVRTPDGSWARLTVVDSGPGITPEDLPHVFTRFWRSAGSGGSGLGMPIVRSVVEAHGGTLRVDSPVAANAGGTGGGTLVTIDLPVLAT